DGEGGQIDHVGELPSLRFEAVELTLPFGEGALDFDEVGGVGRGFEQGPQPVHGGAQGTDTGLEVGVLHCHVVAAGGQAGHATQRPQFFDDAVETVGGHAHGEHTAHFRLFGDRVHAAVRPFDDGGHLPADGDRIAGGELEVSGDDLLP